MKKRLLSILLTASMLIALSQAFCINAFALSPSVTDFDVVLIDKLIVDYDGFENYEENSITGEKYNVWFEYNIQPLKATVTYSDGTTLTGSLDMIEEKTGEMINIENNQSYTSKWGLGSHNVTISYMDMVKTKTIEVIESPVESISAVATAHIMENVDVYYDEYGDNYIYYIPDSIYNVTVNYKNGSSVTYNAGEFMNKTGHALYINTEETEFTVDSYNTVTVEYAGAQTEMQVYLDPYTPSQLDQIPEKTLHKELNFTKASNYPDFEYVTAYGANDNCLLVGGYCGAESEAYNICLATSTDAVNFTTVALKDKVKSALNINSTDDMWDVGLNNIQCIDNVLYLQLLVMEWDQDYNENYRNVFLTTVNGVDYTLLNLPDYIGNSDALQQITINKFKDTYIVFDSIGNYPDEEGRFTYYTSSDFINFTPCLTPAIKDISDYELYGYMDLFNYGGIMMSISSISENGVYFKFETPFYIASFFHGLYYTSDFENYTNVIPDSKVYDSVYVPTGNVKNDVKCFLRLTNDYFGSKQTKVYTFNESTLESSSVYSNDSTLTRWLTIASLGEPLDLHFTENGQNIIHMYSLTTNSIINEGVLPYKEEYNYGFKLVSKDENSDTYILYFDLVNGGNNLVVSDNLYKSVYSVNLDGTTDLTGAMSIELFKDRVVFIGDNIFYSYNYSDISKSFNPVSQNEQGHVYTDWETLTAATQTTEGSKQRTCLLCGEVETQTIAMIKTTSQIFTDVANTAWYSKNGSLDYVYNNELFKGMSDTTFSPQANMTRGMFVTVLGRLAGVKVNNSVATDFTDVPVDKYYTGYVGWAAKNGIVNGMTTTTFEPSSNVTREQLCKMIVEYCNYSLTNLKTDVPEVIFADNDSISGWARSYVSACQKGGLISGKGNNIFDPKGNATRAEVATIMYNFYNLYNKK